MLTSFLVGAALNFVIVMLVRDPRLTPVASKPPPTSRATHHPPHVLSPQFACCPSGASKELKDEKKKL